MQLQCLWATQNKRKMSPAGDYSLFLSGTLLAEPDGASWLLPPPCGYFVNGMLQLRGGKQEGRKKVQIYK